MRSFFPTKAKQKHRRFAKRPVSSHMKERFCKSSGKVVYTIGLVRTEGTRHSGTRHLLFSCKFPTAQADQQRRASYYPFLLSRAWDYMLVYLPSIAQWKRWYLPVVRPLHQVALNHVQQLLCILLAHDLLNHCGRTCTALCCSATPALLARCVL